MATSRSPEPAPPATARACLFSGRPDPTWSLDGGQVAEILTLWNTLAPTTRDIPPAPPLGYRGTFIDLPGHGHLQLYGGVAVRTRDEAAREARLDVDRRLERSILATAPANTVPPEAIPR